MYLYTHIYMYTVHKEIYNCATKISLVVGLGKKCLRNLLRGDSNEKHVEKYCHKEENHYSRGTWEISGSMGIFLRIDLPPLSLCQTTWKEKKGAAEKGADSGGELPQPRARAAGSAERTLQLEQATVAAASHCRGF